MIVAEFCIFNLGNVNLKLHIFLNHEVEFCAQWALLNHASNIWQHLMLYLLNRTIYMIQDLDCRLRCPHDAQKDWFGTPKYTFTITIHLFFFYFTHHILILVSYFLFFNFFSCIYFCSFLADQKLTELANIPWTVVIIHRNYMYELRT